MDTSFRALSLQERALLERLLEPNFPGRDELRAQLDGLVVKALDDEGCLTFECRGGPPAEVKWPVPTEGEGVDTDGAVLHVLLQVANGFIHSLVLWSESETKPSGLPPAGGLKVFAPYSEDAGVWNASDKFRGGDPDQG
jgi:hypothetical protein